MWSLALGRTTPTGRRLYLFGRRAEIEFSSRWFTPYTDTVGLAGTTDSPILLRCFHFQFTYYHYQWSES